MNQLTIRDFTKEEIKKMNLKCGPAGCCKWIPNFWFKSACKAHDIAYAAGYREEDRRQADVQFLKDMCWIIKNDVPWGFKWLARKIRNMFFKTVRNYGKDSFNYGKRYATKQEIIDIFMKRK